jgi:hypothetical protein
MLSEYTVHSRLHPHQQASWTTPDEDWLTPVDYPTFSTLETSNTSSINMILEDMGGAFKLNTILEQDPV